MADIAALGFSVNTKPLDDATVSLNKLVPAAKSAETASKGFVAAINGVSGATGSLNAAAAGMGTLSTASLRAGTAMGTVQSAAAGATGAIKVLGMAGVQQGPPTALWDAYRASLAKVPAAANGAKSALDRLGASANDNISRLQATPGNIAAQFQDIGVTAAGGMSPMLIALQQGTQLAQGLQGGLGPLMAGIGQLFNATTILTIGLVGLGAALLQNIDWVQLGVSALNMLADVMEAAAPYALALGATLLLAFAPQIIALIYSMVVAIGTALVGAIVSATAALWALALANPFTAIILAVAATIAAFVIFGKATVDSVKGPINSIIGGFVGAFNTIRKTWSMLPALIGEDVISTTNLVLRSVDTMVNGVIQKINGLLAGLPDWLGGGKNVITFRANSGQLANPYAGTKQRQYGIAADEMGAAQGVDYVGKIQGAVVAGANYLVDKVRGLASSLGAGDKGKDKKGGADDAAKGGKTEAEKQAEAFDKLRMSTEAYVRTKAAETAAIGLGAREAAMLKHQTDLTNQAIQQGIPLDQARTASITAWAAAMTEADMKLANAQGWQKVIEETASINDAFRAQRDQIGMTADQTSKYKYEVLWLNDQLKKLQDASPEQVAALREFASAAAADEIAIRAMNEELDRTQDALSFVRDGVKGFVSDLKGGLEQGKNFFSAFGDAVLNMLNKIIDKLVDVALNAALGGGGGGLGGFLGALGSIGASLFGGGAGAAAAGATGPIAPFAKGGAFTNSIVSSPTLFKFAKGTGMMGEAGPEAILPLKRGANGSLGVQAIGANDNRGGTSAAPVVNITNTYTISGSSTADMQATVRQSAEQTKDQLRREIPQVLSEYQRNGAIA